MASFDCFLYQKVNKMRQKFRRTFCKTAVFIFLTRITKKGPKFYLNHQSKFRSNDPVLLFGFDFFSIKGKCQWITLFSETLIIKYNSILKIGQKRISTYKGHSLKSGPETLRRRILGLWDPEERDPGIVFLGLGTCDLESRSFRIELVTQIPSISTHTTD